MTYIVVPVEATSNKVELVNYVSSFLYMEATAAIGEKEATQQFKAHNLENIRDLHGLLVSGEYDYAITKYIKKSLKLSYGGSRLFGLSTFEMNEYLTDVKNALKKY